MPGNILYAKTEGEGKPLIVLHGFLGTGDNWLTFARAMGKRRKVYLADQRNHGRSFHRREHTYPLLADDLKRFMDDKGIVKADLLGHSMGGKTAMQFALTFPEMVDHLVVVDIAPGAYKGGHEYILDALLSIDTGRAESRKEVEDRLLEKVRNKGIVLFLMKNLHRRTDGSYEWKMNLEVLSRQYKDIVAAIESENQFRGPVLFVKGGNSDYIKEPDEREIKKLFPASVIEEVSGAGHWVHAEAPDRIFELIAGFLKA